MVSVLVRAAFGLALGAFSVLSQGVDAEDLSQRAVGYQKTGLPVIARQQQLLEKALSACANSSSFRFDMAVAVTLGALVMSRAVDASPRKRSP